MSSADGIISRAWVQIAHYPSAKLRLTDVLTLFNVMEDSTKRQLLSDEYRDFLVEFILECPDAEVDQDQFKSLMERLFESSIDNIIRGGLISRNRERIDTYNDQDFTQTMNIESSKFNSFMMKSSINEREDILRRRIDGLESMISRSQIRGTRDDRTLSKMKDILIGYYKNLDSINRNKYISNDLTKDKIANSLVQRLKNGIDKQDVLINELKRKVGDDKPNGIIGLIRYKLWSMYQFIWRFLRIPFYIIIIILILNILAYVIFDDNENDVYDTGSSEAYWG